MSDGGAGGAASGAAIGATLAAPRHPAFAAEPGRWRESLIVALGPTLAALISLTVQLPGFIGPTVAYFALQRIAVSSWHNLPRRLAYIAGTGFLLVPFGGFLLQQPWFLLPAFFLAVTGTLYFLPLPRRPVEGSSILFVIAVFTYGSLFAPQTMAVAARDVAIEAAIGVLVATLIAETFGGVGPRRRLAASLAAGFVRNRERFHAAIERHRAAAFTPIAGEAEAESTLGNHLQLLDQVRQEGIAHDDERVLVALATAAERIESYVGTLDQLSRQEVGRSYRGLLDDDIARLATALEAAFVAFETACEAIGEPLAGGTDRAAVAWPNLPELVRALEARQLELRRAGALRVDAAESTNANSVVRALAGLADVFHTPPEELAHMAAGAIDGAEAAAPRAWPRLPAVRRFDLRYALHGGLGTTLCLLVGVASNLPELGTILFNPVLVAQTSYGATVRRAGLRMLGVIGGALLGLATIAVVTPNTMDVSVYVGLCFVVAAVCQYVALGSPANWYVSFQVAISFYVVTYSLAPSTDVAAALWRAWGTVLGTALLFAVYGIVAPDYAGRQLVARFADLLRAARDFLPRADRVEPSLTEQIVRRLEVGRAVADALRLADEARFERRQGIDARAAVEAIGIAMRLGYRAGLIARGRAIAPPPRLAAPLAEGLEGVEEAVSAWIEMILDVVEVRDTMSRPGAASHDRARARCAAALARPRPPVAARVRALAEHIESTRFAELAELEPRVSGELLAALEHYRRIGDLLPRLDREIARAFLPGYALAEGVGLEPEPDDTRGVAA